MRKAFVALSVALSFALLFSACAKPADKGPVTLTVWDYYGESTPLKSVAEAFMKENPSITVKIESLDWTTMFTKLNVVLTGGTPPDVATIDMTWLPKLAALGAFSDLKPLSGGKLNGETLDKAYAPGALAAMTYKDKVVTMMYDFDVYSLYYRADLFEKKGLQPPKDWAELSAVAAKLAEKDKYRYAIVPETFHTSQFIYENGGSLLNADDSAAAFNSPEAVEAAQYCADLIKSKGAVLWTPDKGELIQGLKDGRIGMFSDGPYMMGVLKSGAAEMAGQWKVAPHPVGKKGSGSYLGGTGLVIPAKAERQAAAYKFIAFALKGANAVAPFKYAGAAPALLAALKDPAVDAPDPYFGGEKAFAVFLDAMKTARSFPYVRSWSDIDAYFTTAMQEITLGKKTAKAALDEAAAKADEALKQ